GCLLETGAHGLDNGHHSVAKRLPNFVLSEDDGFREAVDEIPALHFHGARLTLPRVRRPEVDLDLLGPTLANQKVIVLPNVLPDGTPTTTLGRRIVRCLRCVCEIK